MICRVRVCQNHVHYISLPLPRLLLNRLLDLRFFVSIIVVNHVQVCGLYCLERLFRLPLNLFFTFLPQVFSHPRTQIVNVIDFCGRQRIVIEFSALERIESLFRLIFVDRGPRQRDLLWAGFCCLEPKILLLGLQLDVVPIHHVTEAMLAHFWV